MVGRRRPARSVVVETRSEMVCTKWMDLYREARAAPRGTLCWFVNAQEESALQERRVDYPHFDFPRFRDVVNESCKDNPRQTSGIEVQSRGNEYTYMVTAKAGRIHGAERLEPALCFKLWFRSTARYKLTLHEDILGLGVPEFDAFPMEFSTYCAVSTMELDRRLNERVAHLWARLRALTRRLVCPTLYLEKLSFRPRADGSAPTRLVDEMERMPMCGGAPKRARLE